MDIFAHHIYEYQKGLRDLVLHTAPKDKLQYMVNKLKNRDIPFIVYPIAQNKINIFFGSLACIDVVKNINCHDLKNLSDEQDFILGIMLGYDRKQQCERLLKRKQLNQMIAL